MPYPLTKVSFPDELLSGDEGFRRLRTDNGEAGFFEGKQFYIAYEFDLSETANRRVIEVIIGGDIILTKSSLEVDQGGVRYSLVIGGTASGTFSESIPVIPKNSMSDTPAYSSFMTFNVGGDVIGGTERPISRVRTASGNNARANAISDTNENRGFTSTTVHLVLEDLVGVNDDSLGILNLEWEER